MPELYVDDLRSRMEDATRIRNVTVIAQADHGQSTLIDTLVAAAGISKREDAGDKRCLSSRCDDVGPERAFLLKATAISLSYHVGVVASDSTDQASRDFVINLIDTPGHIELSAEVTAALRVTDGALVVVDCVEGVGSQTESMLRQALAERVRPVVFINKVDRAIIELQLDPEEAYQRIQETLRKLNNVIATYTDTATGCEQQQVSPEAGTVAMGSGLQEWAFSVPRFARMYASKFGVEESKMCWRLWGDNYFDAKNKKWTKSDTNEQGDRLKRTFCQFCLDPIYQLFDAVVNEKSDKLNHMLAALKISITSEDRNLSPKGLLKTIMSRFLPAAETLLEMVVVQLPSPKTAQAYRAELLYSGEPTDKYYEGIKNCDPTAPLMLYISKMVPVARNGRFFAFGRIFSGTVRSGQRCRIMGNSYRVGKATDLFEGKPVPRVMMMMGRDQEAVEDMPCGNVVGLVGVDKYIVKSATITDDGEALAYPLRDMKYSVSPVVRVAVEPKNPADLPKFVEGLKRLLRSDPLVVCHIMDTGDQVLAGSGELHLQICLKDLQDNFMNGAPLKVSEPVVSFRETVTAVSSMQCVSKSANKHNRLFCRGAPLTDELCIDMEDGKGAADQDPKLRAKFLQDKYEWDGTDAKKIWCYGPDGSGPNVIVDVTKDIANVSEMKDSFTAAWQWATQEGVLCDEPMRGVRMNIEDITMHADAIHRGGGQIIPTARRVALGCFLTALPRLMEPVYEVTIRTVESALVAVRDVLSRHRGAVISEDNHPSGSLHVTVRGFLPVVESFGFTANLRAVTRGQAVVHLAFDHWQPFPGDPLVPGPVADIVRVIRLRKGLKPEIPGLEQFVDAL